MERPETALPKLRSGLRFTPINDNGQAQYILEDPVRNTFYRLGVEEYLFISRLNQASGLEQLLQSVAKTGEAQLSVEQAQAILNWLAARQLLQFDDAGPPCPGAGAGKCAQEPAAFQPAQHYHH